MTVEEKLQSLGYTLPPVVAPLASYVPATQSGNLVYTSGQVPMRSGQLVARGHVDSDVTVEEAKYAAQVCALNCLAAVASVAGDLDRVARIVHVTGYVNSSPDFTGQPEVLNGASDLLLAVFGESGRHSRAAIGVAQLPLGAVVEVDMVVELRDSFPG